MILLTIAPRTKSAPRLDNDNMTSVNAGSRCHHWRATSRVAALRGHFDPWYHGFDTDYPDVRRAQRFISELKRFEAEGRLDPLQPAQRGRKLHLFGRTCEVRALGPRAARPVPRSPRSQPAHESAEVEALKPDQPREILEPSIGYS